MNLNPSQAEAALHTTGPCLVLAGPGSGKTATLTKRTEYLITQCGISPANILVVTFTKAAAGEMRRRFEQNTDKKYRSVSFGTFHSIFFTILKHAYHYSAANIMREETKYQFMREIIAKRRISCEDVAEFSGDILGEISVLKNSGVSLENYYPVHCGKDVFQMLYREYTGYMRNARLIDFDDMLVFTKELLEQRPDIRAAWQQKYTYIMVDEFQDINRLQYETVRLLAGSAANLFVVGDDDQSIYRFRGSMPELMLNFPKDYPSAKIIRLSVNYRCPKEVVQMAGKLIVHNKNRFEKKIESCQTAADAGKRGAPFSCQQYRTQQEENRALAERIRRHVSQGGKYSQIAVLYRTNTQPGPLIAKLMDYNIPFHTKERIPNLYEHWIAKDLAAYFRLAMGSRARGDFLRIMNRPKRYLSRESLPEQEVAFDAWQDYYKEQPWIAGRIEQLECDLRVISRIAPYAAVNYIRKGIGYDEYLADYAQYRQMPSEELFETLEELHESTRDFKEYAQWEAFTRQYTEELKRKQEQASRQPDTDSISILTLHGSKGLEYDIVMIPDVNEGFIPYKKAVLEAEIEEERRMLYVGMTRAKKELQISYVKALRNKAVEPSSFLAEIMGRQKG
ncbi:MAG: ATP-dependent helicase [Eubacterium sp.]|nr:ATP-dependent helicase [Eubacterium sp.]